jgi:hypothetical protein
MKELTHKILCDSEHGHENWRQGGWPRGHLTMEQGRWMIMSPG